jgi:hypothetical protein
VPESDTVCGLPPALYEVPLKAFAALGSNVTLAEQLAPPASEAGSCSSP